MVIYVTILYKMLFVLEEVIGGYWDEEDVYILGVTM